MNISKRKKRRQKTMPVSEEQQLLFDALCEALQKLGTRVRVEDGRFQGGYCLVEGEPYFFLNKRHTIDRQIELLANHLKTMNYEQIYVTPQLRKFLED